ncbi:glycosyltransferase family 39 protein [Plantactinospora solaniradicis]|uniref:Glycosyltransferase family 39 protein n=1 Tax=Plantactinospora solaniradicis TaxID=1723736 RepID=A0ABW1JZ76_9ACTN
MLLPGWLRRANWLWPTLATLIITAVQLDHAPLWRDELATWSAASRPVDDLLRLVGNIDAVNGAYYLLMHAWIAVFGDSVLALRLPSALAMAGAAALTTLLGARLFGPRVGLLGGLLLAVLPSTSRYGQEARPYALVTLLAVLATLLLVRALHRPTWPRWLGYAATLAALGLANLFAVSLLAGHAIAVLLDRQGHRRGGVPVRWVVAVGAAGLVLVPLAVLGRGQQGRQLDWVGRPGLAALVGLPGSVVQAAVVGGLLFGLAALGAASRGRWGAALGLSVLLPAALLFVAGQFTPLFVPRYLVFVVPFGCLLAAGTLAPLRLGAALAIVLTVGVLGTPEQAALRRTHESPRTAPVDYPAAVRIIAAHRQPGDGIVYAPRDGWAFLDLATAYYLPAARPRDVLLAEDQVRRADLWATECAQPERCLASVDRLWLLAWGEHADPLAGVPASRADPLRARFRIDRRWSVPGLTVALLTPPPTRR